MGTLLKFIAAGVLFLLAGSCMTYPYASGFSACDARAGQCYRDCEAYADNDYDYGACHADCENDADICFDNAYGPYNYAGSPYGPGYVSPWYGSYGTWYPQTGFAFSFGYSGNRYDRHRNRGRRWHDRDDDDHHGRDRDDDHHGRGRDDDGPTGVKPRRYQRSPGLARPQGPATVQPAPQQVQPRAQPAPQQPAPPPQTSSPPPQPRAADKPPPPRSPRADGDKQPQ